RTVGVAWVAVGASDVVRARGGRVGIRVEDEQTIRAGRASAADQQGMSRKAEERKEREGGQQPHADVHGVEQRRPADRLCQARGVEVKAKNGLQLGRVPV